PMDRRVPHPARPAHLGTAPCPGTPPLPGPPPTPGPGARCPPRRPPGHPPHRRRAPPPAPAAAGPARAALPAGTLPLERFQVIVPAMAAADPLRLQLDPAAVVAAARSIIAGLVDCLPPAA